MQTPAPIARVPVFKSLLRVLHMHCLTCQCKAVRSRADYTALLEARLPTQAPPEDAASISGTTVAVGLRPNLRHLDPLAGLSSVVQEAEAVLFLDVMCPASILW